MSWVFLFLIILRSSLDIFTKVHVLFPFLNVPSLVGIMIILLGVVVFTRAILRKTVRIHPVTIAWLGWLAFLSISVFVGFRNLGGAGMGGAREWIRLFTIGMVFALSFSLFRDNDKGRKTLDFLFLALLIPLTTAFGQWVFHTGRIIQHKHRVFGMMAHPNSLGFFLVLFIGLTFWKHRTGKKLPWFFLLLIELFVLAQTLNIGAYIMLAILLIWLFVRENKSGKVSIGILALCFSAMVFSGKEIRNKLESAKSMSPSVIAETWKKADVRSDAPPSPKSPAPPTAKRPSKVKDSFTWRVSLWSELLPLIEKKPFFGHGLQSTEHLNPWKTPKGVGYAIHNDFIKYFFETGIVGLLLYLGFLIFCGLRVFIAFRDSRDPYIKSLLYVLLGVFLVWLVGSFADNMITMTSSQFCFWAALGIALSFGEKEKRDLSEAANKKSGITVVYPLDPGGNKFGGIESFIKGMILSLPVSREVRIVGIAVKKDGFRCGVWQEITLWGRNILFFPVLHVDDPNIRTRIPLFFRFSAGLIRWRRKLDLEGRILHFHRLEPAWALVGIKAERVLIVHGDIRAFSSPFCESRWKKIYLLYHGMERIFIGSMRKVFVVSRAGCDYYKKRYPRIRDRFHFLPVSFNPAVFFVDKGLDRPGTLRRLGVPEDSPVILFVGRLEEAKDPFLLLDSFGSLLGTIPNARLLVAGAGTLEKSLKKRAQEIIPQGSIFWLGQKNSQEIAQLMNIAKVLILTSAFEGMPNVVVEALACGLPVVSTDAGDVRLVVEDGTNGRIVSSRNPEEIARAVVDILKDPPRFDPTRPPISEYTSNKVLRMVLDELDRNSNGHV